MESRPISSQIDGWQRGCKCLYRSTDHSLYPSAWHEGAWSISKEINQVSALLERGGQSGAKNGALHHGMKSGTTWLDYCNTVYKRTKQRGEERRAGNFHHVACEQCAVPAFPFNWSSDSFYTPTPQPRCSHWRLPRLPIFRIFITFHGFDLIRHGNQ